MYSGADKAGTPSRVRVHSAPPNEHRPQLRSMPRLLPPIRGEPPRTSTLPKPTTPDPESVRLILEQRIQRALAGPSTLLKRDHVDSGDSVAGPSVNVRRASLRRESAMTSYDLVQLDTEEMSMLRSINRSNYSMSRESTTFGEGLLKHEFEDLSDDDESEHLRQKRKASFLRQSEQEDVNAPLDVVRLHGIRSSQAALKTLEDRLEGYRHEKMRSSTRSGDVNDDLMSGLVYDVDFDCYYNPHTDTYYRLRSQSKSGDDGKT